VHPVDIDGIIRPKYRHQPYKQKASAEARYAKKHREIRGRGRIQHPTRSIPFAKLQAGANREGGRDPIADQKERAQPIGVLARLVLGNRRRFFRLRRRTFW
jgi:hypothetical protein